MGEGWERWCISYVQCLLCTCLHNILLKSIGGNYRGYLICMASCTHALICLSNDKYSQQKLPPPQIKSLPFAILFHIQINRSLPILEQYVKNIYKLKMMYPCMYVSRQQYFHDANKRSIFVLKYLFVFCFLSLLNFFSLTWRSTWKVNSLMWKVKDCTDPATLSPRA